MLVEDAWLAYPRLATPLRRGDDDPPRFAAAFVVRRPEGVFQAIRELAVATWPECEDPSNLSELVLPLNIVDPAKYAGRTVPDSWCDFPWLKAASFMQPDVRDADTWTIMRPGLLLPGMDVQALVKFVPFNVSPRSGGRRGISAVLNAVYYVGRGDADAARDAKAAFLARASKEPGPCLIETRSENLPAPAPSLAAFIKKINARLW